VVPQAPTLVREPFHRDGWVYEEKVDGSRILAASAISNQDRGDLTGRQLRDRRARLEDVVAGSELFFRVRRLAPDGVQAWAQVVQRGYEGYVAKDPASVYEGGPTRRWLKVKQKDWTVAEDGWRRESAPGPRLLDASATLEYQVADGGPVVDSQGEKLARLNGQAERHLVPVCR
jgi:ATP-dependent DNA ligase